MRYPWRLFWVGWLLLMVLLMGACSDDDDQDPCTGENCSGVCTTNEHCAHGLYCGPDNQCIADPCEDFVCERGQCARGTLSCESKPGCTEATESTDCIYGEYCVAGECVNEADFCDNLSCKRGVCDPSARGCVSAVDCEGNDSLCAAGYFCNSMDQCVADLCEQGGIICPDNARCQPAVGACEMPVNCEKSSDCAPDHVCIVADAEQSDASGVCTLESVACGGASGDGGCMGNLVCVYDSVTRSAECVEADICQTALDCVDERQCGGQTCMPPVACVDDALEPNDSLRDATDFNQVAHRGALDASICADDIDIYRIDTRQLGSQIEQGLLRITLEYAPRDLGQGGVRIELFSGESRLQGAPLAVAFSGLAGHRGVAEISHAINPQNAGEYLLRVTDAGDVQSPGVSYRLAANLQPFDASSHCNNARELLPQSPIEGDSAASRHEWLESSCAASDGSGPEDLYYFEVLSPSYVTVSARPEEGSGDLSVSIRRECERLDTELACESSAGGDSAQAEALLAPGVYFAMVEARDAHSAGAYTLSLDMRPAACTPAESYCETPRQAQICGEGGFGFEQENCVVGCDPRTGECLQTLGDHCAYPFVVDADEARAGISTTVAWGDFRDDHRVETGGCVPEPEDGEATHGPDAVWQVEVPAGHALNATLTMSAAEQAALYIFEHCEDVSGSCLAGAYAPDGGEQSVHWANDGEQPRTVFLAADRARRGAHNEAGLEISVDQIACERGETLCQDDELLGCNAARTDFELERDCPMGCEQGACLAPPNDRCEDAQILVPGTVESAEIDLFSPKYSFPSAAMSCAGSTAQGLDAVYAVEVESPDEVVQISLHADFEALIYVSASCTSGPPRCFAASDDATAGMQELSFIAASAGTYFIYVDTEDADVTGGFSIEVDFPELLCTPGDILGCEDGSDAVSYCDENGQITDFLCAGGCDEGVCGEPGGEHCADPIVLNHGDSIDTTLDGENAIELAGGQFGQCQLGSAGPTAGAEDIYRVDLEAGELLTIEFNSQSSAIVPLIAENCHNPAQTCRAIGGQAASSGVDGLNGQNGRLQYFADEQQSVFIIVDAQDIDVTRDDSYQLGIDISTAFSCAPGASRCVDSSTVELCRHDGAGFLAAYECPTGCVDGACAVDPAANRCHDAPELDLQALQDAQNAGDIGAGVSIQGDFSEFSNEVAISSAAQCVTAAGSGPDLVYALNLRGQEALSARLRSAGNARPMLYLVEDCAAPDDACLAGAQARPAADIGWRATLDYRADTDETLYLVADTVDADASGPFLLEIALYEEECEADFEACVDQQTAQYCENGLLKTRPCYYGACEAGQCAPPAHDRCAEAQAVPAGEGVHYFRGFVQDFQNTVDLADALLSCDGVQRATPGPDAFYAVELVAGQVLQARLRAGVDGLVWLSTDCHNAANTCAAAAEPGAGRSLTYRAPSNGVYYIVVDYIDAAPADAEFQLEIQVRDPECSPGEARCLDEQTLQVCSPNLGLWADVTCQFGCADDRQACQSSSDD